MATGTLKRISNYRAFVFFARLAGRPQRIHALQRDPMIGRPWQGKQTGLIRDRTRRNEYADRQNPPAQLRQFGHCLSRDQLGQ
jgi:hypothetical protein